MGEGYKATDVLVEAAREAVEPVAVEGAGSRAEGATTELSCLCCGGAWVANACVSKQQRSMASVSAIFGCLPFR